tara:strand:+ start:1305 stop:2786 length:1482 start_codon:yes stop_codon:yes gene_type:complete
LLPTVPQNVFRITYGKFFDKGYRDLGTQSFNLTDIGRAYFDHTTINNNGHFSSMSDLYHLGDVPFDSIQTVESWLSWFNLFMGTNLPTFESGYIDTTKPVIVGGQFIESQKRSISGRKLKIEFGMSDQITLSISIPAVNYFRIKQSINGSGNPIEGIGDIINFHLNAKTELESFIASDTYFFMRRGLRDSVKMIYDLYYKEDGDYSVLWALSSSNDPFNQGFTDSQFFPSEIGKDTVYLDDLVNYYYPKVKNGSGLDDITLGVTILLKGSPAWSVKKSSGALYGQLKIELPYGYTIRSYIKDREKQFKQASIGSGLTRWSIGLFGEYLLSDNRRPRFYGNINLKTSTPEFLNTPVSLFAGNHSHPDSIINRIGETYKFSEGNLMQLSIGFDFEPKPDRFKVRFGTNYTYKSHDKFYSNYYEWDKLMTSHKGYNSSFQNNIFLLEYWIINSTSKNKIGPFPFDIYAGYQRSLSSDNTFDGWKIYWGSTLYLQAW